MLEKLIEQVRTFLIQEGQNVDRVYVYNRFINECNSLELTEEDFYIKVLKIAFKDINWEAVAVGGLKPGPKATNIVIDIDVPGGLRLLDEMAYTLPKIGDI